jgi:hypothetical protein
MKTLKRIFIVLMFAFCMTSPTFAASNVPGTTAGDVGEYGSWATENNKSLFVKNLTDDINDFQREFQNNQLVRDYVPAEARVGRALMGALDMVGRVLENSLVRFMTIFMIIMFTFWIMFEAYQMMRGNQDAKKLWEEIVKKLVLLMIWIWIIEQGPAQLFMWIMGPVITIGTYLSDLILNSVATAAGASLPDTCAAIHKYMSANTSGLTLINSSQAADLLCVPTRLSGFFYTAVAAGWKWMLAGIGHSAFTFITGAIFVVIFIYNIWKFALMALGVIADMFLTVLMLPFTAFAEVFGGKGTTYDGYAGKIFNGFMELFKPQNLSSQIQRFINAALYFVSLSIVIALCAAILSGIVNANLAATVPGIESDGFMTVLIVGCLVAYLANKAGEIAKNIGGSIDDSFGTQVGNDLKKLWDSTRKTATDWYKAAKKK